MNAKAKKSPADTDNSEPEAIETAPILETPAPTPLEEAIAEAPPVEDNSGHTDLTHPPEDVKPDVKPDEANVGLGEIVTSGGATPDADPTPIGITVPIVPPAEDLADISRSAISTEALNTLDETDSSRAAAIRSQANWATDSVKLFKGPDRDQLELAENLRQMDEMDAARHADQRKADAEKKRVDELAARAQTILDLNQEFDSLKQRAMNIKAEIARLEALDDEPVEAVAPVEPVVEEAEAA